MKVIDLLNKIANGEKIPKKIIWKDKIFDDDTILFLYEYIGYCSNVDIKFKLNCNIDIIEEPQEHKIPEKIEEKNYYKAILDIKNKLIIKINRDLNEDDYELDYNDLFELLDIVNKELGDNE